LNRYKNRLNRFLSSRRPRCLSAPQSASSVSQTVLSVWQVFCAVNVVFCAFTVHAAAKPVEPVSEPVELVLVRLTSRRRLLFLLPFPLSLFTLSFVTVVVAFIFSLSLSHSHHTLNPFRAIKSLRSLLETCSSRPPPSTPSSSLGFLWLNRQIEVLSYFPIFLTRSNTVLDYLVYLFKDTV
jgi:hypothetical protein